MAGAALYYSSFVVLGSLLLLSNFMVVHIAVQMMGYTGAIIYIGSHLSLRMNDVDPSTGEKREKEAMTQRDAFLFPFIGSAALGTLYLAYRFLPKDWVNIILSTYLTLLGCLALGSSIQPLLEPILPGIIRDGSICRKIKIPFVSEPFDLKICPFSVSVVLSLIPAALSLYTKHWAFHNIFAIAFSIQALSLVSLGNFKVAAILLIGLFVYDIFWVFGTEVMVTVAKMFDGPATLIFPVSLSPPKHSILGLGDVIVPGIFVAMCLRFDYYLHDKEKKAEHTVDIHQRFSKTYFWAALIFYLCGILCTYLVLVVFQHPQPALLYLVPFCLSSLLLVGFFKKQLGEVMAFSDGEEESKEEPPVEELKKE